MQKKIIALAIAAAFSAPAFADTNVYGTLDAGYASTSKTLTMTAAASNGKSGEAGLAYSTMASSKLGVMSSEDVGDGIKVMVKVETGIGSNEMAGVSQTGTKAIAANGTTIDATSIGSRELWAGLALSQGTTIVAGYGSTLVRDISLGYDAAPGGNLVGNVLNNDATLGSNRVVGATVKHAFGPVTATVQLSTNTKTQDLVADQKSNNGYLLGLQYADGPVSAGFAYQNLKNATNVVIAVAPVAGNAGTAAAAATDTTQKVMILAGSYDLGVAKLFAEYANIKKDDNLKAANNSKKTYESIGVDVPFTAAVLGFVQLSHGSVDASTTSGSASISGYTVGGKFNVSKTTYGYASVGNTKLNDIAGNNGVKVDQFVVGLVKNF